MGHTTIGIGDAINLIGTSLSLKHVVDKCY